MGCGYKGLVFCRNIGWIMENMDKVFIPKWVLIVWPKISQMPQNLSAQFFCPSPKFLDFNERRLHWTSIVRNSYRCSLWFDEIYREAISRVFIAIRRFCEKFAIMQLECMTDQNVRVVWNLVPFNQTLLNQKWFMIYSLTFFFHCSHAGWGTRRQIKIIA